MHGRASVFGVAVLTQLARSLASSLKGGVRWLRADSPREDPQTPMGELVTVATYDKAVDAHIALGRLAAEGIEARLFDEQMVQMDWLYAIALGGIKLRVSRDDAPAARKVLETDWSAVLEGVESDELSE